jgi:hypothetical protein
MFFLCFGSLILLHLALAAVFYRRGNQIAGVFNLSCITLVVYVLLRR